MPRNSYSKDMEKDIIKLYNEGYSGRKIIEKLNAPSKQVYSVIKNINSPFKIIFRQPIKTRTSGFTISFPLSFLEGIGMPINTTEKVKIVLNKKTRKITLQENDESEKNQ